MADKPQTSALAGDKGKNGSETNPEVVKLRKAVDQRLLLLETYRWSWFQTHRLLARQIQPRLGRFIPWPNIGNRGSPKNQHIINSTATITSQRFAAGMLSGATSPARPWARFRLAGQQEEPTGDVRTWLDMVRDRMFHVFAESNFYDAIGQVYEHEGVFGTALVWEHEDFEDVARFSVSACGEYYLATDDRLDVTTAYRRFVRTAGQVAGKFGEENCSASIRTMLKNGQQDAEVVIAHGCEPNIGDVPDLARIKGLPYRSVYWEWGQSGNMILEARGYHEKPFAAPRWNVTSNDAYGRGWGHDALGDVIGIQVLEKRLAQAIDKVVNPPMIADARLRNEPASTISGGVTYAIPGVEGMKPMYQITPDIKAMIEEIQRCENRVKSSGFEDLFLMISNIDRDMTAYEVARRQEEKMLMLGPPLERNHRELLRPIIERTFGIMGRVRLQDGSSLIPPPPSQISGKHLNIEFISILAQAQKAVATGAIERVWQFAGNLAAANPNDPSVLDNLDPDSSIRDYADLIGTPTNILVPEAKMAEVRSARMKAQQQAQQQQQLMAMAEGAKTLSQTDVGGGMNVISAMTGLGAAQQGGGAAPQGAAA